MTETIWVVMGSTGEYSNRSEWLVCAYRDEAAAKRHADDATARALLFHRGKCQHGKDLSADCAGCGRETGFGGSDQLRAWMGALDPVACAMDYTGSDYVAIPVDLRERPHDPT